MGSVLRSAPRCYPPAEEATARLHTCLHRTTPGRDRDARFAPGFVRSGARHSAGPALGGFDPAHDIAGITVNRWPHGYAYSVDAESGDVAWWPKWWRHERRPWVDARQRVGNIAFAGTDAASNAMTETAIEEAHRAIHSLGKEATL